MHDRRPRHDAGARARAAERAGLQSASVSIDGIEATHDRAARRHRLVRRCARRGGQPARRRRPRVGQHADQQAVDGGAARRAGDDHRARRAQLADPAHRRDGPRRRSSRSVLLQPYDLLELFPLLATPASALRRGRRPALARQQHRLLRPVRVDAARQRCRAATWRRAAPACSAHRASRPTARSRAARRWRPSRGAGGNVRDARAATTSGSAPRRCASSAVAPSTICGATAATCYYADVCTAGCTWTSEALFGKPGNNPMCHHRALEMQRVGKRERFVQIARAPGVPFDQAKFSLIVEDIE